MTLNPGDLEYYLTGGAGNSDPDASLGGVISTTQCGTALHDLFDAVVPDEASAGSIEYRFIDVYNSSVTDTSYATYLWIAVETTSASSQIDLAYDSTGTQLLASETTTPNDPVLTFSHPTSKATGIALGDIAPGETRRVCVRRTITAGAAQINPDECTIRCTGGTA